MQIVNVKFYYDLPFDEYLRLPGRSFSSIKGGIIEETDGMRLGTRVHNYLLEPAKYDWMQPGLVVPMAAALRTFLGSAMQYLQKEVAFTCDFIHNGMRLQYRGRADLMLRGRLIIDLKCLAGDLLGAVQRYGYDNQVSGYCLGSGSPSGLIVSFNKIKKVKSPSEAIEYLNIIPNLDFWPYQCVRLGIPA